MRLTSLFAAALTAVTLTLATPAVGAAAAPEASYRAAFKNFHLTDGFLSHYLPFELDAARHPCRYGWFRVLMQAGKHHWSLDQAAAAYDARPGIYALLTKHGLTARKVLVGGSVYSRVASTVVMERQSADKKKSGMSSSKAPPSQRANIAFYKAHMSEIKPFQAKMHAIGKQYLHANGGKVPACSGNVDSH